MMIIIVNIISRLLDALWVRHVGGGGMCAEPKERLLCRMLEDCWLDINEGP